MYLILAIVGVQTLVALVVALITPVVATLVVHAVAHVVVAVEVAEAEVIRDNLFNDIPHPFNLIVGLYYIQPTIYSHTAYHVYSTPS